MMELYFVRCIVHREIRAFEALLVTLPIDFPKFNIDDDLIVQRLMTVTETDSGTDFMELNAIDDLNKEEKSQLKNEFVAKAANNYDTNDLENSNQFTERYESAPNDYVKRMEMMNYESSFFFKKEEYKPQVITPPIIIKSPLLKFNESKIFKSSLVIIDKIPNTEIIKPNI